MAAAAGAAAVALFVAFTLPPSSRTLEGNGAPPVLLGAFHVHSSRSDGTGTVDEIAAAASRAGLAFVVFADHGDATRVPDPPIYRHGVLCIDAVEVSSFGGHVVALGLRAPSAYPLAGETRDVIEDIRRLGGYAVAAHPDSPRPGLRWRAASASFDGIEWINADSEWRDDPPRRLLATALRSLVRPAESIASLFDRPARTMQRWDAALRARPVFSIAALDAHARIGADDEVPRRGAVLQRPRYVDMFRTIAQAVPAGPALTGDAGPDAARVVEALAAGRSFSILRAVAEPATVEFTAEVSGVTLPMGATLPIAAGAVVLRAAIPQAPSAQIVLLRDGAEVQTGKGHLEHRMPAASGAFRLEAYLDGVTTPWIVSNPIRIGLPDTPVALPPATGPGAPPSTLAPGTAQRLDLSGDGAWAIEHDPTSRGTVSADGAWLRYQYRLGSGTPAGQFAAMATTAAGDAGLDRIEFVGRADRPMRVSVQVRVGSGRGQRWRRSVYLDTTPRQVVVPLSDMDPAEVATRLRPVVARVHAVLIVVDTLNSATGAEGEIHLRDLNLVIAGGG